MRQVTGSAIEMLTIPHRAAADIFFLSPELDAVSEQLRTIASLKRDVNTYRLVGICLLRNLELPCRFLFRPLP